MNDDDIATSFLIKDSRVEYNTDEIESVDSEFSIL